MFLGEYQHSLDNKGRITIPARYREELGSEFVATKGLENCIFLFPVKEWQAFAAQIKSLPMARADARGFARFLLAGACEMEMDRQGRVLLPANLREYADIEKDLVIIGVGARVEIWSRDRWAVYSESAEQSFVDITANLVDLNI